MANKKRKLKLWVMETGTITIQTLCNALEDWSMGLTMPTNEQYKLEDWPHPFKRPLFFPLESYLLQENQTTI